MSEENNKVSDISKDNIPEELDTLSKSELINLIDKLVLSLHEVEYQLKILKANNSVIERVEISKEEEIALTQLEMLKSKTSNRQMSLEEARIFDILVKNKRLSQGDSTTITADYERLDRIDSKKLISIAKKNTKKSGSNVQ
jgi:hypothetical protein